MELIINRQVLNETTQIFTIEGEIDLYTSSQLRQEIASAIEIGMKHLIANLSKAAYLDSSGLSVFISGMKRLNDSEGSLVLVALTPRVQRIFELTGLGNYFSIYATDEEAIAKMNPPV